MQPLELDAHLRTELRVQVREWLVEKADRGVAHEGPADRRPLPLSPRECRGLAVEEIGYLEEVRGLAHLLVDVLLALFFHPEAESHVPVDGLRRVERVRLEDHREIALAGILVGHVLAGDLDPAPLDVEKPRDAVEQRGLAAARGPEENEEFPRIDFETDVLEYVVVALINLVDVLDRDLRHTLLLILSARQL